jgi:hypothetical protein
MLENTEGAVKNGQSRETSNRWFQERRKTKPNHNAMCRTQLQLYTQTNTNNVNMLQTTLN